MEKPTINYAIAYQKFRGELSSSIASLQKKYPLPTYMVEGVLSGILSDVRSANIVEHTLEESAFQESLEKYYEEREKDLHEEMLKDKAKEEEKP